MPMSSGGTVEAEFEDRKKSVGRSQRREKHGAGSSSSPKPLHVSLVRVKVKVKVKVGRRDVPHKKLRCLCSLTENRPGDAWS